VNKRVALITGITGQDGSYLSELLLQKGYEVHGIVRRNSDFTSKRIDPILYNENFTTHYGDVVDSSSLHTLLAKIEPDEIYHLAAQSHVAVSFEVPDYSAQVNALGTLRLLTAIRDVGLPARFYQASSSELFGGFPETLPQNENTPFSPQSPYAVAKLFAYWTVRNMREAYGLHASNGILFNHESPRRGRTFVTKKISQAVANIAKGKQQLIKLGNLDARRDWGYAPEYVEAMWTMLQQPQADDYVIGTGVSHSVREFVEWAFKAVDIELEWVGSGIEEQGIDTKTGELRVVIDPVYFRPLEVNELCADNSKAERALGWKPKVLAPLLAKIMVDYDMLFDEYGFAEKSLSDYLSQIEQE
jgi:GDPmannose 4,6-dehydratase